MPEVIHGGDAEPLRGSAVDVHERLDERVEITIGGDSVEVAGIEINVGTVVVSETKKGCICIGNAEIHVA